MKSRTGNRVQLDPDNDGQQRARKPTGRSGGPGRSLYLRYRNTLLGGLFGLLNGLLIGQIPLVGEYLRGTATVVCVTIGVVLGFRDDMYERRLRLIFLEALIEFESRKER